MKVKEDGKRERMDIKIWVEDCFNLNSLVLVLWIEIEKKGLVFTGLIFLGHSVLGTNFTCHT